MNTRDALTQLAADKRTLESKLRDLIAKEVDDFTAKTGVSVDVIDVRTINCALDMRPHQIVSGVSVGLVL